MMNSIKKKLIVIAVLLLMIIGVKALTLLNPNEEIIVEEIKEEPTIKEPEETVVKEETTVEDTHRSYSENKQINDDYVARLYFKSGLIDLPVVQAKGELSDYTFYAYAGNNVVDYNAGCEGGVCDLNDVYLRKDWISGEYKAEGSTFMDSRNSLDDQNIIIYGHSSPRNIDKDRQSMFTPLENLTVKDNYLLNSEICLELENEIRTYKIAYVYLFDKASDDYETLQYYRTNYNVDYFGKEDPGYYDKYISKMEKEKIYETDVELTTSDNTLTLQTCYEGGNRLLIIIVAKEV